MTDLEKLGELLGNNIQDTRHLQRQFIGPAGAVIDRPEFYFDKTTLQDSGLRIFNLDLGSSFILGHISLGRLGGLPENTQFESGNTVTGINSIEFWSGENWGGDVNGSGLWSSEQAYAGTRSALIMFSGTNGGTEALPNWNFTISGTAQGFTAGAFYSYRSRTFTENISVTPSGVGPTVRFDIESGASTLYTIDNPITWNTGSWVTDRETFQVSGTATHLKISLLMRAPANADVIGSMFVDDIRVHKADTVVGNYRFPYLGDDRGSFGQIGPSGLLI